MRHGLWTLVILFLLSGCTTDRPLPDSRTASSLIEYVQALRRETSTLLDTVVAASTSPTQDLPEYRDWGDHWCPRHVEVHSTDDVVRKVAAYCTNLGGTYEEPFCRQATAPDHVLFLAQFRRGIDLCQGVAATVSVEIVEPKAGMLLSAAYLNRLRSAGYHSAGDDARAAFAAQRALETERARLERELPRLRTRGTQVCRTQDDVTFLGYVEDSSGPKIQVSIHEARMGTGPNGRGLGPRNSNYRQETVWDVPEHWFICEAE